MIIAYPIAFPVACTLNKLLGHALPTMYSHSELMEIVSEHEDSEHSRIDADEERIVHGALQFSHRKVRDVMTAITDVVMFDENQKLSHEFFIQVGDNGYSRYPVFSGKRTNIVGLLYAKDLLTEDDHIAIHETEDAFETNILRIRPGTFLDIVLSQMLKQKRHLAIVETKSGEAIGVLSLEDIIEEIIQVEIDDEDDAEDV